MENNKYIKNYDTRMIFGKDTIKLLSREIKRIKVHRALIVYGKESAKKLNVYNEVVSILEENNIKHVELPRVEANPKCYFVRDGVSLCKQNDIDFILAIGGGSVIDCAKIISAAVFFDGDSWDLMGHPHLLKKALKVGCILTRPSLGAEMSDFAYLTSVKKREKKVIKSTILRPVFAIIDPKYTMDLPVDYNVINKFTKIVNIYRNMYIKIA